MLINCFAFSSIAQVKKSFPAKKPVVTKKIAAKPIAPKTLSNVRIKITTDSGIIVIKLSDSTPNHRNNFVKLVKQKFYDSLLFHRVIPNFMIQGGDPTSKNAAPGAFLGNGGDTMTMTPAEFKPYLFHKRGVLAAARNGDNVNPMKSSNACQFYIVTGRIFSNDELNQFELRMNRKFTPEERTAYTTIGGVPWLDQNYTVFGEVESGMDAVDKISAAAKDGNDRPLTDIRMKIEIIKP
ncbi:peptidylprolyl isomerase [Ferruginibacter albus]|nr:peptidylprolyl isomerase [Ferruginibacter albus]